MKTVEFGNLKPSELESGIRGQEQSKSVPVEHLLMAKNKTLQSQLVQIRTQLGELQGLLEIHLASYYVC